MSKSSHALTRKTETITLSAVNVLLLLKSHHCADPIAYCGMWIFD